MHSAVLPVRFHNRVLVDLLEGDGAVCWISLHRVLSTVELGVVTLAAWVGRRQTLRRAVIRDGCTVLRIELNLLRLPYPGDGIGPGTCRTDSLKCFLCNDGFAIRRGKIGVVLVQGVAVGGDLIDLLVDDPCPSASP